MIPERCSSAAAARAMDRPSRRPTVLIVSAPEDIHATTVARKLIEIGARPELLDLREYPARLTASLRYGDGENITLQLPNGLVVHDSDVSALWWRRPQRPVVPAEVRDPAHRRFALNEAYCTLNGLWHCLTCRWVNPLQADSAAAHKPYQLRIAAAVGLVVPDTLITNDPAAARAFADAHDGRVVYKALAGLPDAWRETRRLRPEEQQFLPYVRYAPVIFQELIAGTDLRVTVVGDDIFAAEMDTSRSRYPYDVRMDMTVPVRPVQLDAGTAEGVHRLMQRLGLVYGAIDMRRRSDGSYVFLEINPAGQFLYIEELTDLPISGAMAALLANGRQE